MARYVYYCERCSTAFEVEVDDPEKSAAPPETVCPGCDYPHALRAFVANEPSASDCCAPDAGGGG